MRPGTGAACIWVSLPCASEKRSCFYSKLSCSLPVNADSVPSTTVLYAHNFI